MNMFDLALRLGKTVAELNVKLTRSEFLEWIAYFKINKKNEVKN